jgi:MFS transporter, DHA1 family, multidrug resistance protein B
MNFGGYGMFLKDWDLNLKIRLFGEGITNVLFWMFFPFMSVYFSQVFGKEWAGGMLVFSQLLGVIANLIGGYCADRFGRKRMMELSAFAKGVSFLVFAFANSPWYTSPILTYISFAALGICGSLYWPASHAMVADLVKEEDRNQVFAIFYTAINLSVVIGPLLGSIFFFHYRFGLLLVAALTAFVLSLLIRRFVSETIPERAVAHQGNRLKAQGWRQFVHSHLQDYRVILSDRTFMLFILAGILVAQTFMQLDLALGIYVTEKFPRQTLFHVGEWSLEAGGTTFFGWLVAENGLLIALFTVWVSRWVGRMQEKRVFLSSAFLYGISMLAFGSSTNIWVALAAMVLFTVGELLVVGLQESFVSKLAPEHIRGQYFAAASMRFTIGKTLAPFSIPLAAWVGYGWMFVVLACLAWLGGFIYMAMFRRLERQPVIIAADHSA